MTEAEPVNPLDISFSNEKYFVEPSTPSQPSANKGEFSSPSPRKVVTSSFARIVQTPRTPKHRHYSITKPFSSTQAPSMRYASLRKEPAPFGAEIRLNREWNNCRLSHQRRLRMNKWESVQMGHLKEIARLDALLTRVDLSLIGSERRRRRQ